MPQSVLRMIEGGMIGNYLDKFHHLRSSGESCSHRRSLRLGVHPRLRRGTS